MFAYLLLLPDTKRESVYMSIVHQQNKWDFIFTPIIGSLTWGSKERSDDMGLNASSALWHPTPFLHDEEKRKLFASRVWTGKCSSNPNQELTFPLELTSTKLWPGLFIWSSYQQMFVELAEHPGWNITVHTGSTCRVAPEEVTRCGWKRKWPHLGQELPTRRGSQLGRTKPKTPKMWRYTTDDWSQVESADGRSTFSSTSGQTCDECWPTGSVRPGLTKLSHPSMSASVWLCRWRKIMEDVT